MARTSTTSDVFNAVAEARRRDNLDALIAGEKPVGTIVNDLSLSQPQVSKHLRVLSKVGLVCSRAEGPARSTASRIDAPPVERHDHPVAGRSEGERRFQ